MPDDIRRYLVVVQAEQGYPAPGAPLEPAPPDGPAPPCIHQAVLVKDFERVVAEREEFREQIDWTIERCNVAIGEGFAGTANSAVAAVCDLVERLRAELARMESVDG